MRMELINEAITQLGSTRKINKINRLNSIHSHTKVNNTKEEWLKAVEMQMNEGISNRRRREADIKEKKLQDMVLFDDLPELKPMYAEVSGVEWVTSKSPGQSGCLFFPSTFSGQVPVQFATKELLGYYDVTIAGNLTFRAAQ